MPEHPETDLPDEALAVRVTRAAAMLDLSRAFMYEQIANGKIASVRIGGTRRIPVEELRRLASEGTE